MFATIIEANYLSKHEGVNSQFVLTQEDTDEINRLSKLPDVFDRIVRSIAPSIYGHKEIKTGMVSVLGITVLYVYLERFDLNVILFDTIDQRLP